MIRIQIVIVLRFRFRLPPSPFPSGTGAAHGSRRIFPEGEWQFLHSIQVEMPGGRNFVMMGLTVISSRLQTRRSVIMTLEGFVVFDGEYDHRLVVHRALRGLRRLRRRLPVPVRDADRRFPRAPRHPPSPRPLRDVRPLRRRLRLRGAGPGARLGARDARPGRSVRHDPPHYARGGRSAGRAASGSRGR